MLPRLKLSGVKLSLPSPVGVSLFLQGSSVFVDLLLDGRGKLWVNLLEKGVLVVVVVGV